MTVWIPVIVAVLGSLGGATLISLLLIKRQAAKLAADTDLTEANAVDTLAGVAVKLVEPLTRRLADAETRATALGAALQATQAELQATQAELHDLRTTVTQMTKELEVKTAELEKARTPRRR